MRVLAVTNMYPTEANPWIGTAIEQQVKGLRRIGVEVSLLHLDRVHEGARVYRDAGLLAQREAEKFGADLVHVMYGGVMAERITRVVRDWPIVITFHGSDLLGEPLSSVPRRMLATFGVWSSVKAARRACGVIVMSKQMQSVIPRSVDRKKIRVIPTGIDPERFRPMDKATCQAALKWDPGCFHVLFPATNGNPVKRPALAQAAVDNLQRGGIRAEMHRLQGVPHVSVPLWLNASDVVLLTSEHEGSPNIVKEALACNRPVVSVDVGDVKDRIEGVEGCHIALPEESDLAAKLQVVYESRHAVRSRGRIQDLSLVSISLLVQRFYAEILGSWQHVRKREHPDVIQAS